MNYHCFETAVGRCAILWRGDKITGVLLPAANEAAMQTAIERRDATAIEATPPAIVREVVDKIVALCRGEQVSFENAPLDRSAIEPMANQVYDVLLDTPFGETTTYGAIAEKLGDKALSRAVGEALGKNPFPIVIPCHRVIAAGGRMGGFSAPGGVAAKRRLLEIEGSFAPEKLPLFSA